MAKTRLLNALTCINYATTKGHYSNMTFPINAVRSQYPSLSTTDEGQRRIYFDNAAGTQVPKQTINRIVDFFHRFNSNTGVFNPTSVEVDAMYAGATQAMADFLGTRDPGEVLIGANMTTLTYQLSRSLAHQFEPGDEIIISRMEHEGNVTPWLQMAEDNGLTVKWLEFDRDSWRVEPALLEPLLGNRTRLLALNYASNLTGGVNDVKTLTAMAQAAGAIVYVDAVQFASHRLIDVVDLDCDFLACSPYKFYGPHLGVVFGKRARLEALHAYKLRCATDELPLRLSLGTPAFELIAGLMGTLEYFQWVAAEVGAAVIVGNSSRAPTPRWALTRMPYPSDYWQACWSCRVSRCKAPARWKIGWRRFPSPMIDTPPVRLPGSSPPRGFTVTGVTTTPLR